MSSFLQGATFATMQLPDPYSTSDSIATSRDTSILSSTEERKKSSIGVREPKSGCLKSLDIYIPVGVLKRCDVESGSNENSEFPHAELSSLESHSWVRTQCHPYDGHPGWFYVRVYVLPDNRCCDFVQRIRSALRRALKVVMSKIDCSSEAWEGRFATENTPKGVTEDESLWYIFNTLENPDPKMENMNILGRRAVEDILLNDTGSAAGSGERSNATGLKTALYPYQRRSAATMIQREVQPAQSLDPRLQPHRTPAGEEYYYDKEEGIILREKRLYSEACGGMSPPVHDAPMAD